jgi:hypothetical protein
MPYLLKYMRPKIYRQKFLQMIFRIFCIITTIIVLTDYYYCDMWQRIQATIEEMPFLCDGQ